MASFSDLWKNFPEKESIKARCTNKQPTSNKPFSDYCAILMSECLIRSGIDISAYKGARCWSHAGKKHILLAEDLALGLKSSVPSGFKTMKKINPGAFQDELDGKTGVIFFKDYWQRGKESFENRSGDHIDLWNKDKITSSSMLIRGVLEFLGRVSDLNKSKEIWFWEVK